MPTQVIEREKLGVLTKIGQGGQGVVYGAPNVKTKFAGSMVYKEYKKQTLAEIDFAALAAMPALVEDSLSYNQAERLISIAAWPCALVEESGTPTGFVMPAIPDEFFVSLKTVKGVSSATAEFQHLLNHPSVLAARGIDIDDAQRYSLLREVASGLAFLHKHGVCVGDISPKNLLFSLTPHEAVYFIDCDAMRINNVSALPQVETPGWDAPSGEEMATIYSDAYKLGLLALRLVTGDHDTKNPQHLPSTTPAMLCQIITDTLTNQPPQRPLPEAWTYVLGHAIEQAQHEKRTASAVEAPVPAALTPPPIPEVRSRPPAHSRPPMPPSQPPPPTPTPQHWRGLQSRQARLQLIAAIVLILAVGIGIIVYGLRQPSTQSSAINTTAPTATTSAGPPPVADAALDGLLLSPDQINSAMGTTGMTPQGTFQLREYSYKVSPPECLPISTSADSDVYAGSGYAAGLSQSLWEQGSPQSDHYVAQGVVSFASAKAAAAFISASTQNWPACANRTFTSGDTRFEAGPVSATNGILSATYTRKDNIDWACQRALTARNNVVIDAQACSRNNITNQAVEIADQIAAKVPT